MRQEHITLHLMSESNSVRQLLYRIQGIQRIQRTKLNLSLLGLGLSSLLITLAFATPTFYNPVQISFAQTSAPFVRSFENLVKKANNLSQSYHNETGKSAKGQIDNKTIIAITDSFQPKYQALINEAKSLQP